MWKIVIHLLHFCYSSLSFDGDSTGEEGRIGDVCIIIYSVVFHKPINVEFVIGYNTFTL